MNFLQNNGLLFISDRFIISIFPYKEKFVKERKNNIFKNSSKAEIIAIILPLLCSVFILFHNASATNKRILEQSAEYVKSNTVQSADLMDKFFLNARNSLEVVGRLAAVKINEDGFISSDDIAVLEDEVYFDRLFFIDANGIGLDKNGNTFDCSSSKGFINCMKGETGISSGEMSGDSTKGNLYFYAPVKNGDDILGCITGAFVDDTLTDAMEISYFGETSKVLLCQPDGKLIAATFETAGDETVQEYFYRTDRIDKKTADEMTAHLESDTPYGFNFKGQYGMSSAYMIKLENTELVLVQTLPSQSTSMLRNDANKDSTELALMLALIFIIYISFIVYSFRKRQKLAEDENRSINDIITAVTKMFDRFVYVDLENDSYEYIHDNDENALAGVEDTGSYSDFVDKIFTGCIKSANGGNPESMAEYMTKDALIKAFANGTETLQYEYSEEFDKNSDFRWTTLSVLCVERRKGTAVKVLMASNDATKLKEEQIKAQELLQNAYLTAQNASRAKSDFLSKMSHDIRTPMNAIVGMTALAASHIDDKARIEDCLKKITSSSRHLLSLINEVLDMSRIESGKLTLSEEEFSLSELTETTINMIKNDMKVKKQSLTVTVENVEHEKVIGDSLRIQKIFMNIISNSIKYTPENGKIKIAISERNTNQNNMGCYQFVFEDNGIGMPPEFLEKLFTPFERANDSRIDKIQGTGLGMAIVYSIVQMMGGDIKVESEINRGTKFTVTIFLKLQEEKGIPLEKLIDLSVLVADDEQSACEAACGMLETLGMKSEWVLNGMDAVQRVKEHHDENNDFYAVILDWKMPEMDGIETARQIRKQVGPDVPLIIMTAFDWRDIEYEARAAGVDAFISKPLFKTKLAATFYNLLEGENTSDDDEFENINIGSYDGKRVLLVEDNELNTEIAKEILCTAGLEVDTASNGRIAVDKVLENKENYYDMIFMDIQMPVMNGYEACSAIRSINRPDLNRIPIIALSANAFAEDVIAAKNAGMNEHISKPIEMVQLEAILKKWL